MKADHEMYADESYIPHPVKEDMAEVLGDTLQSNWNEELRRANLGKRKPSIFRAVVAIFRSNLLIGCSILSVRELYANMAQPLCLSYLVRYFDGNTDVSINEAYLLAALIIFNTFILIVVHHSAYYRLYRMGMQMKTACCTLIYRKCLQLHKLKGRNISTGQIVNLMSNDVNKFEKVFVYLLYLIAAPIQIVLITAVLWKMYVGPASVAPSTFFILCFPALVVSGVAINRIRAATAERTDTRIRHMTEIINGMRVIKMYAWENSFAKLIAAARSLEMRKIRLSSLLGAASHCFFKISTKIAMLCFLVPYILTVNRITAEKMFVCLLYIETLRNSVTLYMMTATRNVAEAVTSMQRIQYFLLLDDMDQYRDLFNAESVSKMDGADDERFLCKADEQHDENYKFTGPQKKLINSFNVTKLEKTDDENTGSLKPKQEFKPVGQEKEQHPVGSVVVSNVSAHWEDDKPPVLQHITCEVKTGQLLAVVGPVACGKTSLLQAIVGEFPPRTGNISVNGRIAYVPQEPWIFSASFKQNILFGQSYDKERFRKVIEVCELEEDLLQLPHGEQSLVGEKGVTLSGGQRARVALARAVYFDADVYILDDPLSAVDSRTGRKLFERCIMGYLKDKAKVLVTHQLQYLQEADDILVMKEGKIIERGSYSELKKRETEFLSLLISKNQKEEPFEDKEEAFGKIFEVTRVSAWLNMEKKEYRAVIKYLNLKSMSPSQIHEDKVKTLTDRAPSYATVKRWVTELQRDRESVEDDHRSGTPTTATTKENIDFLLQLMMDDRRMSCRQVAEKLGFSTERADNILHQVHFVYSKSSTVRG